MNLSTDLKYNWLCVAEATDGYYSKTKLFQFTYIEELTPLLEQFQREMFSEKKDKFSFELFDCKYKGPVKFKAEIRLIKPTVTVR